MALLFMGEEYGETAPFLFFEDFSDSEIVEAAREGRSREFAFEGGQRHDPARGAFEASKLQWGLLETPERKSARRRALKALAGRALSGSLTGHRAGFPIRPAR